MSLFTHWVCFSCRKSFHKKPNETAWKCPECAESMTDMGVYFEPPRKQAKRKWEIMQFLAEYGYRFQTEGAKVYVEKFILGSNNPRLLKVRETVEAEKQARIKSKQKDRVEFYQESKGKL